MNILKNIKALAMFALLIGIAPAVYAKASAKDVKKEIIVASYGTTYNKTRTITIGGIENAFREAYPDYKIERVFTFQYFIDKLKEKEGLSIMNINEALEQAIADGIEEVVIQPTFVLTGNELNEFFETAKTYEKSFKKMTFSTPLISNQEDIQQVARIFVDRTAEYDDGETAICIMGHGNDSDSNKMYKEMENYLQSSGKKNYFVGTVHDSASVDEIFKVMHKRGYYKNVLLIPMMITSGEHIISDMAGDGPESWKSIFTMLGFKVTCIFEGLGQYYDIQRMFVEHTEKCLKNN